ncbi:unnamed protein product [Calypogeia fissa]
MDPRSRSEKYKKGAGQKTWLSSALGIAHFLPGFLVGVLVGLMVEIPQKNKKLSAKESIREKQKRAAEIRGGVKRGTKAAAAARANSASPASIDGGGELKMVLVVRLDLKMKSGKIASQCAHAAVGSYEECLGRGQRYLLKKWEDCGQPKIVVTCNSQNEMNELRAKAENIGLPAFTVADAGRTQVAAGSQTVLAIGPGLKTTVDSITRHLALL